MKPKRKNKPPAIVDAFDRGTAKTRRRQREPTLDRLIRERRIDNEMIQAAKEIQQVYFALTRQLWAKTSSMERIDGGTPAETPEWLVEAYKHRYLPWADILDRHLECPAQSIIFDVVVDNRKLKYLDRKHAKRDGFARQVTIAGLKLYVDLAGWRRRTPRRADIAQAV